jgi:hypothetical protein
LKSKYPEVELFDFPQKSMFRSSSDKLFRKESFHIFLNLLLTLKPMPRELEHFLEVRKHQRTTGVSSTSSRASFESSHSIESLSTRPSLDYLPPSLSSSENSQTKENKVSFTQTSSPPATVITLTPMALFAYILLFSTWVGSSVWLYIKGF